MDTSFAFVLGDKAARRVLLVVAQHVKRIKEKPLFYPPKREIEERPFSLYKLIT